MASASGTLQLCNNVPIQEIQLGRVHNKFLDVNAVWRIWFAACDRACFQLNEDLTCQINKRAVPNWSLRSTLGIDVININN